MTSMEESGSASSHFAETAPSPERPACTFPTTSPSSVPRLCSQLGTMDFPVSVSNLCVEEGPARTASRRLSRQSLESTMDELNEVSKGIPDAEVKECLPEPENSLRRPFWQLLLIQRTITSGGFLNPKLYVPRLAWEQYGAHVNGLSTKMTAFEAVLSLLLGCPLPVQLLLNAPGSGVGKNNMPAPAKALGTLGLEEVDDQRVREDLLKAQKALQAFRELRAEFDVVQNSLARSFPFLRPVASEDSGARREGIGRRGRSSSRPGDSSSPVPSFGDAFSLAMSAGGGMQHIRGLMASFGRKIHKGAVSAMTAYERMGVLAAKISDAELQSYSALVCEVCEKAQRLDGWFLYLDDSRRMLEKFLSRHVSSCSSPQAPAASSFSSSSLSLMETLRALQHCVENSLVELLHCARFLQDVVVELVLRDVESLLDSYLRRARKVFSRMVWELEDSEAP